MKLKSILPWFFVLSLSAAFAAVYVKSAGKDSELAKLREENKAIEQLQADVTAAQVKAQVPEDQVLVSRKDKEELIRLRGEVSKLRGDNQKQSKDLQTLQSRADSAKAQADDAVRQAEAARAQATLALTTQKAPNGDAQRNACINNLRQLDGAKQQWALENNKTAESVPTAQEIAPFLKDHVLPACPVAGTYTLNPVGQVPVCSIQGHALTP